MRYIDFHQYKAEPRGREDGLRYSVTEMKYSQDVLTDKSRYRHVPLPGRYTDRNNETTGAVTSS